MFDRDDADTGLQTVRLVATIRPGWRFDRLRQLLRHHPGDSAWRAPVAQIGKNLSELGIAIGPTGDPLAMLAAKMLGRDQHIAVRHRPQFDSVAVAENLTDRRDRRSW